jgi:predicted dehydrogenase
LHASLACQAAATGKHVLVEKPLATTMAGAANMIQSARENGVVLRTFLSRKYRAPYRFGRSLIHADAIGDLIGFAITSYLDQSFSYWTGGRRARWQSSWRAKKETSGGGILIMNLVHDIDALLSLTGLEVRDVFCFYDTLHQPVEVEDIVSVSIRGLKGEIGTVTAASAFKGRGPNELRIWGHNGQITINQDTVTFYSLRPICEYPAQRQHVVRFEKPDRDDSRIQCLDEFTHDVRTGQTTDFSEPGYRSLAIIMAAYESGAGRQPIELEPPSVDRLLETTHC